MTPSTSQLEHANGCVPLSRLVTSASLRAVAARIDVVRACLRNRGLRVTGGPAFPSTPATPHSPDGELIAGAANTGGAFVAFYGTPDKAKRLEPEVRRNAARFGGQVERHGAVTVLWIHPPSSTARTTMEKCAFQ